MWMHITYTAIFILQTNAEFEQVLWQIYKKSQLPQPFAMGGNSEDSEEQQKDGLANTLQHFRDQMQ
jgi:hypothetical protein